jgi:S1-C subfamily serine protease
MMLCLLFPTSVRAQKARPRPVVPPGALSEDEQNTISVFKKFAPSVVTVVNKGLISSFFGMEVFEVERGAGSGFVWDEDGHIVSNYHVVHQASAIEVIFKDGRRLDAEVVGVDPDHDLAVLRVRSEKPLPPPVQIGSSHDLVVGQKVLAIGNPFGLDSSLSVGVVSSLGRSIQSMTGLTIHDVIQTDAAINPGNSGGPLLDRSARLIGVNTAIISPSGGSVGIGFAVPVDIVNYIVPELITFGRVRRAGLGVSLIDDGRARYLGVKGAVIRHVFEGTAAEKAGLRGLQSRSGRYYLGDVIVGIDDQEIQSLVELRDALNKYRPGETVILDVMRDGKNYKLKLTLQSLEL